MPKFATVGTIEVATGWEDHLLLLLRAKKRTHARGKGSLFDYLFDERKYVTHGLAWRLEIRTSWRARTDRDGHAPITGG